MGNKPPKQNTDWTEEMNQYILKNYFSKGIRAVAKDLGRTKDAIRSHISTLRNEGYFDNMFDHVSKRDFIEAIMEIQEFHYELINNINDIQKETDKMVQQNLELHYHMYKDLMNKFKHASND